MVELPTTFRSPAAFRRTTYINRKPASNLWHAFTAAERIGLPFNTFVTLNLTALPPDDVSQTFRRLLERHFAPWYRRGTHSGPSTYAYAWVIEAAGGQRAVHWALHVPPARSTDFREQLTRWLQRLAGAENEDGSIHIQPITTWGVRLYMLKGAQPWYAAFCQIKHVPQGIVIGKRSGFSRSVGPEARRRRGIRPRARFVPKVTE
jgi:hypothetical protein